MPSTLLPASSASSFAATRSSSASPSFKDVDEKPKELHSGNGWRVVMWSRTVSCNCWHKGCILNVPDISVEESMYLSLPSGLKCDNVFEKLLYSAFPTLSTDDDDILYLKFVSKFSDPNGWMVALDLRRKRLKGLGAYSSTMHDPFVKSYCPYIFDDHLNMDPGIKDSACCKSIQVGGYVNDPNNMAQQQQRFIKRDKPCHPSCSSRRHPNNLPPQQCFDKWVRPCDPYAPLAPAPNLHDYGNYQPLWQQPPPLVWQLTASSMFGHYEAPKPCFNHWDGVSYPGSSRQQPASSPFAYGTHQDYCNYQRQCVLHHVQDLPTCPCSMAGATTVAASADT